MPLCVQHPAFILRPVSRNVPPVQLTQINTEMEGWEEMRISIQSRVITCCKSGNQSMQYLFFKEPGFAGWDRLTCKKRQQMLAFLPKAREEKDSFKKQKTTPSRRLELRKELISAVSAVQLSWRREVSDGKAVSKNSGAFQCLQTELQKCSDLVEKLRNL